MAHVRNRLNLDAMTPVATQLPPTLISNNLSP